MKEINLIDLLIEHGFREEWFDNSKKICKILVLSDGSFFAPFSFKHRIFNKIDLFHVIIY